MPKKKKSNRGGKRKGAGRPPEPETRKVAYCGKLSPLVIEFLRALGKGYGSPFIEDRVRRSKEFREWNRD